MEKAFWLSGSISERKSTLDKIKSEFSDDETFIISSETSIKDLEEIIYSSDCFISKKIIILNDFPKTTTSRASLVTQMKKIIENIPNNCCIIFNNLSGEGEKPLKTLVSKVGKLSEFDCTLEKTNAYFWVIKEFISSEKTISEEDAKLFIEINGYDAENKGIGVDILRVGIQKILHSVGKKRKTIEKSDIIINSFPSSDFIIWSIFDAMDLKNIVLCQESFAKMLENKDNLERAIFDMLNVSLWRFRLLMFLKELAAKGHSKSEMLNLALGLNKISSDQGDKGAYSQFIVDKEINGTYGKKSTLENYSRKELVRIVQVLQDYFFESRNRTNEASLRLLVDTVFYTICNSLTDDNLAKIKEIGNKEV